MAAILLLTQVLPYPLDAGPKVRAYTMLRHLAQRHAVILVSFVRPDDRAGARGAPARHRGRGAHRAHPPLGRGQRGRGSQGAVHRPAGRTCCRSQTIVQCRQ